MSSALKAFIQACDEISSFQAKNLSGDLRNITKGGFEARKIRLDGSWASVQTNYFKLVDSDETDAQVAKKYDSVSTMYIDLTAKILDELEKLKPGPSANQSDPNSTFFGQSNIILTEQKDVRLPTIQISKFSGDYKSWRSFHDLFKSLIGDNPKLKPVEKLYYLLGNLEGAPKELVSKYRLEDASFEIAWNALKGEYDNLRILVNAQLKQLFSIPITKSESAASIKLIKTTVNDVLASLKSLEIETKNWDPILVYLVTKKLPTQSHSLWEHSLGSSTELPTWAELDNFLKTRFRTLEAVGEVQNSPTQNNFNNNKPKFFQPSKFNYLHAQTTRTCKCCKKEPHSLRNCPKFLELDVDSRIKFVRTNKLCINCLAAHKFSECPSRFTCRHCQNKHNSLLHIQRNSPPTVTSNHTQQSEAQASPSTAAMATTVQANLAINGNRKIILSTALIDVNINNQKHTLRALIDSGSEATFILENAVKRLRLPISKVSAVVTGMGAQPSATVAGAIKLSLTSKDRTLQTEALVLRKLTNYLPSEEIEEKFLPNLENLKLADPLFFKPGKIEIVIGADIYSQILTGEVIRVTNTLTAIDTIFGYVITGSVPAPNCPTHIVSMVNQISLDDQIRQFWEMEEISTTKALSPEDQHVENFYKSTHFRRHDGRYVVKLPFLKEYPLDQNLASSRGIALKRFISTEHKFSRNPEYKTLYTNLLDEYLQLGHMTSVTPCEKIININNKPHYASYYMPHHGVLKTTANKTKLRVVFDGSCATENHTALNEVLYSGPALQNDLTMVVLRARRYPFLLSADIQQMYRQIFVNDEDVDYQRILFRKSTDGPILDYALRTVTFGLNCSPFLAIRTLHQLADDEKLNYPLAAPIVKKDCYVDDLLFGANTIDEAEAVKGQVIKMLLSAGFDFRKWCSNCPNLLPDIPREYQTSDELSEFSEESCPKTLGILWNNRLDYFTFRVEKSTLKPPFTKRKVFSEIMKLFDPAGWLAPVIVRAKILIQKIWSDGTGWDEQIISPRADEWNQISNELKNLERVRIPRWLNTLPTRVSEIHGFSDASMSAMCCCVYSRVILENGEISVNLITAKTKVAPLKTISLPRLELCAAVMLAKLMRSVRTNLELENHKYTAWCDSTITLSWIRSDNPSKWKTFVANRLSNIRESAPNVQWRFIPTDLNAADPGSRGLSPTEFLSNSIWFNGPTFLKTPYSEWPTFENPELDTQMEVKQIKAFSATVHDFESIIMRFSNIHKTLRVLAYCFRIIAHVKKEFKFSGRQLSIDEINQAKIKIIKLTQRQYFPQEYSNLENKTAISKKSILLALNPFLDSNGVIRMNGRLANLSTKYDERYPIILHHDAHYSNLLLNDLHSYTLHGNVQLMCNIARKTCWILRLKQKVKKVVFNCKKCFVERKETLSQVMGSLPVTRITPSRPFSNIGIDFGGPITLKLYKGRCNKVSKGYICLFVCFASKAIHLEAVHSLEGQAFLSAFNRFIARRGLPASVFLDNAGNHIYVANYFNKEFRTAIKNSIDEAKHYFLSRQIDFQFNCPLASHRAGLAEAGIKSAKYHLRRAVGKNILTFEELSTLLCQIEACLNSRPLCALTEDKDDFNPLTPGHFLIGDALLTPPEPSKEIETINDLKRLDYLTKCKVDFWNRWKDEYVHRLQSRVKWRTPSVNLKVGALVILKNELTPPQSWPLGRVTEVLKNSDGFVRICKVKTQLGEYTRPITKLCLLPLPEADESN